MECVYYYGDETISSIAAELIPAEALAELYRFDDSRQALMMTLARVMESLSEKRSKLYRQMNACTDDDERTGVEYRYDKCDAVLEWLDNIHESLKNVIID